VSVGGVVPAAQVQFVKLVDGTLNGTTPIGGGANGLKVDGSAVTQPVSGTVTANAGTGPFPISDNAGSITVDAPVATPVAIRLSDGAAFISALPITDNGGSLTVDGAVTVSGTATVTGSGTFTTKEVRAATSAVTSTATSNVSATILASNANRLGATIYNDSLVDMYVKFGATASATSFTVKMAAASYFETPFAWTGIIDAILASSTGNARVTELTA
jgi:hypothetical protein